MVNNIRTIDGEVPHRRKEEHQLLLMMLCAAQQSAVFPHPNWHVDGHSRQAIKKLIPEEENEFRHLVFYEVT